MNLDFLNKYKKEETHIPEVKTTFVNGESNTPTNAIERIKNLKGKVQYNPINDQSVKLTADEKINQQISHEPPQENYGIEIEPHENIRFLKSLPRFENKHKDHSAIIVAKECLRKYFYKEVLCLVPATSANLYYPWGTSYHIFRQKLDELYGFGDNEPATFDEEKAKQAFIKAAVEGLEFWKNNGEDQKAGSKLDFFTTDRLRRSFQVAFDHWCTEKKQGKVKVIAVEQFFTIQLKDGRFVQGRIDRWVEFGGKMWVQDYKTTTHDENWYGKGLNPNNQVRTYTFAISKLSQTPAAGALIECMFNAKDTKSEKKGPKIYVKSVECTIAEIEQWEEEQVYWNKILQMCRETDIWPQSEVNCKYCDYHDVCSKPTEAGQIYQLQSRYVRKVRNPILID